jgi:zinc transport system permease protein
MIVVPTLTGFAVSRSFRQATTIAVASALLSVAVGLAAAYYLGLAAGGAIVLTALVLFGVFSLVGRLRGHLDALARQGPGP